MYQSFVNSNKDLIYSFFNFIPKDSNGSDFENILNNNLDKLRPLYESKKYKQILSTIKPEFHSEFKSTVLNAFALQLYDVYKIYTSGEKIFRAEENFTLQMLNTEFKEIPAKLIKLPYNTIELQVPYQYFNVDNTTIQYINTIVIDSSRKFDDSTEFAITFYGHDKFTNTITPQYHSFIVLNHDEDIQKQFHQQLKKQLEEDENTKNHFKGGTISSNFEHYKRTLSFVFNTLLYISSPEKQIDYIIDGQERLQKLKGKERQKYKKKLNDKPKIGIIGGKIILSNTDRQLYLDRLQSNGNPLTVKVLVMGHWRQQWYGSKQQDNLHQKAIWIQPFWRGIENEIISNKIHILI